MGSLKKAAKNQGNNGRWDEPIKSEMFPIPTKATPVRLWSDITEIRQHWVEFVSKTKGNTGYGELCLNWDPATETENLDAGCPLCASGKKPMVYYYGFLFNRRAQAKTQNTTVQPVRLTGKLAGKIGKLSEIAYPDMGDDAPDATDPKQGFDVFISQSNVNSKVEYDAQFGEKRPLTKEEKAAFEEYAEEHSIGAMAKPFIKSRADLLDKLGKMGVEGFSAVRKDKAGDRPAKSRNYEDYDQAPDDDEDPASPPPSKSKQAEKPKQKASLTGDDDEDEESGARVRPSGKKSRLDDEEETPSRSYAAPDEDEAPSEDED